jgi:hypothetical protein
VTDEATKPKIDLSVTQIASAALVTATTTVAASYFGTTGGLIGAMAMSALSTVAGAVYKHSLTVIPARVKNGHLIPAHREWRWHFPKLSRPQWTGLAILAASIFGGVLILQTVAEAAAGKPVANIVRGTPGHGTTLGGGGNGPGPAVSPSVEPSQSATPSMTPTTVPPPVSTPSAPSVPRTVPSSPVPIPSPDLPQVPVAPSAGPTG